MKFSGATGSAVAAAVATMLIANFAAGTAAVAEPQKCADGKKCKDTNSCKGHSGCS